MSSPATANEATANPEAGNPSLTAEPGDAQAAVMNDPVIARASLLLDAFTARYRQLTQESAEPEIPADVPYFTSEHDPWAF